MPIYALPTKSLMREFAAEQLQPGQTFKRGDAVAWFAARYPKISRSTVEMHVEGMAVNTPQWRQHHPSIKPGSGHDLFFKLGQGLYRLWEPDKDGSPVYGGAGHAELATDDLDEEVVADEVTPELASREFAFERDLKNYLARNIQSLEPGMSLYVDGDVTGIEFEAGGRFIDILAVDKGGGLVVVELKVSRSHDRVIGQLLRYMGWVRLNLANGRPVRGIIVGSSITEDLKLAASEIADVKLMQYEISFSLTPVS
ncbi:MAG: DUF91 domain-containing protein [Verrucomicrobiaceae bacterium]|nr:MAG: DUF91 domain-containing protein [Verrucomicrobiaceae bacterium]